MNIKRFLEAKAGNALRVDELPSAFLASASQPEHPCMRDMGVSMLQGQRFVVIRT